MRSSKNRLLWVVIALLWSTVLVGGVWWYFNTEPNVLAQVNGTEITAAMVEREINLKRLDLTDTLPPLTAAEEAQLRQETVTELVDRQLMLQAAAEADLVLDEAEVARRVDVLLGGYGQQGLPTGTDTEADAYRQLVEQALSRAGLTEADLTMWVRQIYTVETFVDDIIAPDAATYTERQQAVERWLRQARQQGTVETYL